MESKYILRRELHASPAEIDLTQGNDRDQLRGDTVDPGGSPEAAFVLAHLALDYTPAGHNDNILKHVRAYRTLHARFLRSKSARILLQRERNRPSCLNFGKDFRGKFRKVECFRHEMRFVVIMLNLYDEICIEQAWRRLLCHFDPSDTVSRSYDSVRESLSDDCTLSDSVLDLKLKRVLEFAVDAQDSAFEHVDQTRVGFSDILHDLLLKLETTKDPGDDAHARAYLLENLRGLCALLKAN